MRLLGIHHVQLAMPEGAEMEATRFYEEVLGLTQVPKLWAFAVLLVVVVLATTRSREPRLTE